MPPSRTASLSLIVALSVAGLSQLPASAESDACESAAAPTVTEPVQLCEETVIRGDAAGSVEVYLPEDVSFDALHLESKVDYGSFEIQVASDKFGGFALVRHEQPSPGAPWFRPYVVGMWLPETMRFDGYFEERAFASLTTFQEEILPAGYYTLYLLAEPGSATEVSLRFPGLTGDADLTPQRASTLDVERFDSLWPTPDERNLFVGGRDGEIRVGGAFALTLMAKGDFPRAGTASLCDYMGGATSDNVYYSPTCVPSIAGGNNGFFGQPATTFVATGNDNFEAWQLLGDALPGKEGLAASYRSGGMTTSLDVMGVWISFN
jgi:hypothetical protein